MIEEIYVYRSLVITLSVSSSNTFSISWISVLTSGTRSIWDPILSSLSNSFIAKKRFCCSSTIPVSFSSTFLMISSASLENSCTGTTALFCRASPTAFSAAFLMPVPFNAEISTTSHPSFLLSSWIWIRSPFFSNTSIILTAITTGIPSSISCVERYRFLSIFVPSTIFKIASGRSPIR